MKATRPVLLGMIVAGLLLAGVMSWSAYCHFTGHPIPGYVGVAGSIAALVFAWLGRQIRIPGE